MGRRGPACRRCRGEFPLLTSVDGESLTDARKASQMYYRSTYRNDLATDICLQAMERDHVPNVKSPT